MINFIEDTLRKSYPNSRSITDFLLSEMVELCQSKGIDEDGFFLALKRYRQKDDRYNFVPSAREIGKYAVVEHKQQPKTMWNLFINTVVNNGWDVAVHTALTGKLGGNTAQCEAMKQLLIHSGIEENTVPYFGFPDWLQMFCTILHEHNDPAAAYSYAEHNAPKDVQPFYQKKHELLCKMSTENQRKYFPYFCRRHGQKDMR